jgi:hypothetical protein
MRQLPIFEVDKQGLAKLLERRGKAFAVTELIQNSWDEASGNVSVTLEPIPGRAAARLIVEDDNPEGFADLSHAYTLFAESAKKADPTRRGRFNLGEKLVLAICDEASIVSTTGAVIFEGDHRRLSRKRRSSGSRFEGVLRMRRDEYEETCQVVGTLLPPDNVSTTFNGRLLPRRDPVHVFSVTLPTEIADEEGRLRPTERQTTIKVFEPTADETPALYELGIPVVETGDRWHIDVSQKVPLNTDRDNVTPAYLRKVRTLVLNEMAEHLAGEEAAANWVSQALESKDVSPVAVRQVVRERYGADAVRYDPSDPEGSKLSMSQGRTVIPPRAFSKSAWENVRESGIAPPAGQVTPSPRAYSMDPDAPVRQSYPEENWTEGMRAVIAYTEMLAEQLVGAQVTVLLINDLGVPASATYGRLSKKAGQMEFNVARLGKAWFRVGTEKVDQLIVHELAHHLASDHLSSEYHEALCLLAARLKQLALDEPEVLWQFERPLSTSGQAGAEKNNL